MIYFVRTLIDLPDTLMQPLTELCRQKDISRAEAIRQAIAHYLEERLPAADDRAFGLWRRRPKNAVAYQDRLRREWER